MKQTLSTLWDNCPPNKLTLQRGEVHLWRVSLDTRPQQITQYKKTLSDDELARAERLLDPAKARAFIAARGSMRHILGRYLGLAPGEIPFDYGEYGKPHLGEGMDRRLSFNLSHTGNMALLALTYDAEVGVDIEEIDPLLDYEKLAAQFFSSSEQKQLMQFPAARRRRGFYRLWTGKEATLKCLGHGFSLPGKGSGNEERLLQGPSKDKQGIKSFYFARNFVGNLVVAGDLSSLKRWHLGS